MLNWQAFRLRWVSIRACSPCSPMRSLARRASSSWARMRPPACWLPPSLPHWPTLAAGAATLAGLIVMRRVIPKAPIYLIAMAAVGVIAYALGAASYGIKLVGEVPSGLPSLGLPGLGYSAAQTLAMDAVGLV